MALVDGLLKGSHDQSWCWKRVGRERSQWLACLVTRDREPAAGRRAAQKVETAAKTHHAGGNHFFCPSLLQWPCANHRARLQTAPFPASLLPMNYPEARADSPKQSVKLKGWFLILLQGSGTVFTPRTRTWLQPLQSWQNCAQKSTLNLKPKYQHLKLVV